MQLTPVSLYMSFSSSFEAQSISSLTPSSSLSRPCNCLIHFLIILRDLSTRSMTLPCYPNCTAYFSEFSFTHHTVPLLHSLQVLTLLLYLPHSLMWPFHGFLITNVFASSSVWILKCSSLTSLPLPQPSLLQMEFSWKHPSFFLSFFFLATPHGKDLSSPTRDWTQA